MDKCRVNAQRVYPCNAILLQQTSCTPVIVYLHRMQRSQTLQSVKQGPDHSPNQGPNQYQEQYNNQYNNQYHRHTQNEDETTLMDERERLQLDTEFVRQRLRGEYSLSSITHDEMDTYMALLKGDETGEFLIMPNHHTDVIGNIHGFRYSTNFESDISVLPMTQQMFHGISCAECHDQSQSLHRQAIRLLSDPEGCHAKMHEMLKFLRDGQAMMDTASFDCIPVNADASYEQHVYNPKSSSSSAPTHNQSQAHMSEGRDCKAWAYDIPSFVGIYHAYVRGKDADVREQKLFLIVGGGCRKACDQYSNMIKDISNNATVGELLVSDESWWLRRACQRNRCGIIRKLAKIFDLKIQCTLDSNNYDTNATMATPITDTLIHDIQKLQNGKVAIYNDCCDTTNVQNGIIHNMHAAEGVWMFQGATRTTSSLRTSFGGMFGNQSTCGSFPVCTFQVPDNETTSRVIRKERNVVSLKQNDNVVWYDMKGNIVTTPHIQSNYVRCDENYLKHLESMQWNRDNQVIEFIPIIVASMLPTNILTS
jgi:hypothetical protein